MEQREASQPPVDAFLVEVDGDGGGEDEDDDYVLSQELEAKLEASRLREEQLIAEVEAVRVLSTFESFQLFSCFKFSVVSNFQLFHLLSRFNFCVTLTFEL